MRSAEPLKTLEAKIRPQFDLVWSWVGKNGQRPHVLPAETQFRNVGFRLYVVSLAMIMNLIIETRLADIR